MAQVLLVSICAYFLSKKVGKFIQSQKLNQKKNRKVNGVKYIFCDVSDKNKLRKKLADHYDYVINVSGYVDHSKKRSIMRSHYQGCKNLVDILKKKNLKNSFKLGQVSNMGKKNHLIKKLMLKNLILYLFMVMLSLLALSFYFLLLKKSLFQYQY